MMKPVLEAATLPLTIEKHLEALDLQGDHLNREIHSLSEKTDHLSEYTNRISVKIFFASRLILLLFFSAVGVLVSSLSSHIIINLSGLFLFGFGLYGIMLAVVVPYLFSSSTNLEECKKEMEKGLNIAAMASVATIAAVLGLTPLIIPYL